MRATTTIYRRRTEEEWDRIAGEYVESGLTQQVFCESRGVAVSSLQGALRRIAQREEELGASRAMEFVEVEVRPETVRAPQMPSSAQTLYEVAFGTGTRLRLCRGFDVEEVRRLLQLLKEVEG
jgi:hypothetical protein